MSSSEIFPIGCLADWHSPSQAIPSSPLLREWLLDTGSLTARLQAHCAQFTVELLGEVWCHDDSPEKAYLEQAAPMNVRERLNAEPCLIREVLLLCDGIPWVYAHSVLPASTLAASQAGLAELGTRPLGEILFNQPSMQRSAIEVALMPESSPVLRLAQQWGQSVTQPLWGRRSLFYLNDHPLLVNEIFLPEAQAYQE